MQEEGANARICQLVVRSLSKPPNYLNEAPAGLGGGKLRLTTSDRARFVVSHSWSTNSSYAGEGGPTHIVSSARRSIKENARLLVFSAGRVNRNFATRVRKTADTG